MNKTKKPSPPSSDKVEGAKLFVVLSKASRSVMNYAQKSISQLDMCITDFAIMEALLHKGPLPVNIIGKKVLVTSGSITTAVDRLQQRNFVERFDVPEDRRVRMVCLTKEGTKVIKTAFAEHARHLNKVVSSLNQKEQKLLLELLKKLGEGADDLLHEKSIKDLD